MLVGERMSKPAITISPGVSVPEAHQLMREKNIRRLPVINKRDRLVGIISNEDVVNASPSPATSLSIWEINYLINKLEVKEIMTTEVITVEVTDTIEKAARLMADHKIGGLPVLDQDQVVGVITETDLFKLFMELAGSRDPGLRLTLLIPNRIGEIAQLTQAISEAGGDIIALGIYEAEDPDQGELFLKLKNLEEEELLPVIQPFVDNIKDIRSYG